MKNINLTITKDEALVLYEFLAKFNETTHPNSFEDQAEQKMLWILEGQLEMQLEEMFSPDYKNIINEARKNVHDK